VKVVCAVKAEIHRDLTRVAWLGVDRNIVAIKASLWHFLIYERRIEIPTVVKVVLLELALQLYHHATGR
jgi:hypothetical protein